LVRGGACRQSRRSRSRRLSVLGSRATPEQLEQHRSAGPRQSANPIPTVADRSVVAGAAISTTLQLSARRKSPRWCGRFTRREPAATAGPRPALRAPRVCRARPQRTSLARKPCTSRLRQPPPTVCPDQSRGSRAEQVRRTQRRDACGARKEGLDPVSLGARGAAREALRGDRCRSCERPTDGEPVSAFVGWRRSQRRRRA
jgi:hypothetical protein